MIRVQRVVLLSRLFEGVKEGRDVGATLGMEGRKQ